MIFASPVYSKVSGSIAGLTYSHNKGGMYVRARSMPTDPQSALQVAMRTAMATLSAYWNDTLTSTHRNAWNAYGANVAMTNKLGETIYLSGLQQFIRTNSVRLQAGLSILAPAPTTFNLGTFTAPTIDEANDNPEIDVAFTNTDAWAAGVGGYLFAWGGRPQNPGVNFFKGPFRFMGSVAGAAVAPSSPETFTSQYVLEEGQKVWVQCRIMQIDGRLSEPVILGPETVASGA